MNEILLDEVQEMLKLKATFYVNFKSKIALFPKQ
jgi:hypothetical protein